MAVGCNTGHIWNIQEEREYTALCTHNATWSQIHDCYSKTWGGREVTWGEGRGQGLYNAYNYVELGISKISKEKKIKIKCDLNS